MHCAGCAHETSVTAGTVFEGTRKPLRLWFLVMWLMMGQKTGVSAKNLESLLGFGSYQTIWAWLHKLRSVMVRQGRERLNGKVEVDETYIGGHRKELRGRGGEGKTLVAVAVEVCEKRLGRVRLRCIPDASGKMLMAFAKDNIEPGSHVVTDGWSGYRALEKKGYRHEARPKKQRPDGEDTLLPNVHLLVLLLKRWLRGTHQAGVNPHHLQAYLNEFAFRFNRRLSTHRGKLFYRLVQQAVTTRTPGIKEFYRRD